MADGDRGGEWLHKVHDCPHSESSNGGRISFRRVPLVPCSLPLKKLMPAAMTSKGVIAGRHLNLVLKKVLARASSYVENQGNELQGPSLYLFSGRGVVPQGPVKSHPVLRAVSSA